MRGLLAGDSHQIAAVSIVAPKIRCASFPPINRIRQVRVSPWPFAVGAHQKSSANKKSDERRNKVIDVRYGVP